MPPSFDPYYRWLGIAPEEQPPHHYRLLGLRTFEADADVIESAADRQMRHIQTFKTGAHSEASQHLLNEVAAARLCLLTSNRKVDYDAQLRSSLSAAAPVAVATAAPPPPPKLRAPLPPPQLPAAAPRPGPVQPSTPLIQTGEASHRRYRSSAGSGWTVPVVGLAAIGIFAAVAWFVWRLSPTAPKLNPVADQTIDEGQSITIDISAANQAQNPPKLTFELLAGSPAGVDLNRDTGRLAWTPNETQGPGIHRFGVRASVEGSPHLRDDLAFQITVNEVPTAPQLEPVKLQSNRLRTSVDCVLKAKDPDHPPGKIVYGVKVDPVPSAAPRLDADSGAFVWQPAPGDTGRSYRLTFQAAKAALPDLKAEQTVAVELPSVEFGRERMAADLTAAGAEVNYVGPVEPAMFGGQLHLYEVDGQDVYVSEYATTLDASAAATHLELESGQFNGLPLKFKDPTHFFLKERLLVHYVGDDAELFRRLTVVLGKSIGVGHPVKEPLGNVAQPAPRKRWPVPDVQESDAAKVLIREIFERAKPRTAEDKLALAKKLYDNAMATVDKPTDRYALLLESSELAISIGELSQAWRALDVLTAEFEVDAFELKHSALKRAIGVGRTAVENLQLALRYRELIDLAVKAERFETAMDLCNAATNAASKARNSEQAHKFQERLREVRDLKRAFEAAQAARKVLVDSPADATANQELGSYLCFWCNKWPEGLPLLKKSSSAKVREAAQLDFENPTEANSQRAAGNAWLAAADALRPSPEKEAISQRAAYWYRLAAPQLNGLDKIDVEQKLEKLPPPNAQKPEEFAPFVMPQANAARADKLAPPPAVAPVQARLPPIPNPNDPQRDWIVAKAILRFPPSHLRVQVGKNSILVLREAALPATPFVIKEVTLAGAEVPDGLLPFLVGQGGLELITIKAEARITDEGVAQLAKIESLARVQLYGNLLTDASLERLATLPRLQLLHASGGSYTDKGIEKLAARGELQDLQVWGQCTDASFAHLAELSRLKKLSIASDQFAGVGLSHLATLPVLADLSLNCPKLADEHLPQLVQCKALTTLALKSNCTDAAWNVLPRLAGLTSLTLDSPQLSGRGLADLGAITGLHTLNLRGGSPLTDDACSVLVSLSKLFVDRGELLTDAGLAKLSASTSLKELTVYHAGQVTNGGLAQLAKLPELKTLALHDADRISDEGLLNFRDSTNLVTLTISAKQVTRAGKDALKSLLPRCEIR